MMNIDNNSSDTLQTNFKLKNMMIKFLDVSQKIKNIKFEGKIMKFI